MFRKGGQTLGGDWTHHFHSRPIRFLHCQLLTKRGFLLVREATQFHPPSLPSPLFPSFYFLLQSSSGHGRRRLTMYHPLCPPGSFRSIHSCRVSIIIVDAGQVGSLQVIHTGFNLQCCHKGNVLAKTVYNKHVVPHRPGNSVIITEER